MKLALNSLLNVLKAAGEETRIRILALFKGGELTVTELATIMRQSQPRISRHLRLLCEAGLLERHREGTWIFYRLADLGEQADLVNSIMNYIPYQDQILQHDQKRLEEVKKTRDLKAASYFQENAANWDKIRSLYVPERQVEDYLLEITNNLEIETLLDVGTGTGRMLKLFSPHTKQGIGIDLSHEMLGVARSHLENNAITNMQIRHGDMYDLALMDGSMDLVLFHQVLHFADDPLAAIRETARILRPDGIVIVIDFLPHKNEKLREEHAHRRLGFSEEEINEWCRITDLKITTTKVMRGKELDLFIWVATKK
ncbi:MAG: metalloregulator ArsR/SmtB family transcription factor [Kordiimonadaceae bacterium]|jgi:ubiquinone/menaquinone biosynthesis C-methylase UbiE|nr:metalloregulator ArsR/SmtB family transcription factor [Kordiimonadaceae bacterium]MDB4044366.1 metalloregulator ArsR/SmtB family transcription factor [Emcibacteraceae bacterium]MBT6467128.1 metalloregulator ArsR/SmtB family transcription factor [Kordiimonadaceae bacterium]MBT7545056.1 metalloregulator ArsR/SmtB family transcription factor [Kordiimonadaceae bacterium]MBT7604966.1 metalloregulator ArsR/SmtB family transcription factor [Kordiimonadaceae bacterium]|tara:strand:- start:3987 stop:4925 length:939 start_codon:yes stop_codon:yes gene_type:complete